MQPCALWAILWGDRGQFHEVRVGHATCWIPCVQRGAFERLIVADDVMISAVPRYRHDPWALADTRVLWARMDAPGCAELLARLPVGPSVVIREGTSSRRTALWALSQPIHGDWVTRANGRLSHAVQGRRRTGDASWQFPSPFTRMTIGRKRPVKAFVEYESDSYATAREIVGRLPDAPATDGWKEQRDAA